MIIFINSFLNGSHDDGLELNPKTNLEKKKKKKEKTMSAL